MNTQKRGFFGAVNGNKKAQHAKTLFLSGASKKAQGFLVAIKLVESLKILLLIIFGIGIFLFLLSPKSISPETKKDLSETMYLRGITNNPECFAYKGINGRVDQRILDSSKFSTAILDDCLSKPENRDVSDTHSASINFVHYYKEINSSEWVYPLLFEYSTVPIMIKEKILGENLEDTLIFYLEFN